MIALKPCQQRVLELACGAVEVGTLSVPQGLLPLGAQSQVLRLQPEEIALRIKS